MSLIQKLNNKGPSIEPWGTPFCISAQLLRSPWSLICLYRMIPCIWSLLYFIILCSDKLYQIKLYSQCLPKVSDKIYQIKLYSQCLPQVTDKLYQIKLYSQCLPQVTDKLYHIKLYSHCLPQDTGNRHQ